MTKLTSDQLRELHTLSDNYKTSDDIRAKEAALDQIKDKVNQLMDEARQEEDAQKFIEIKNILQQSIGIQKELGYRDENGNLIERNN